MVSVRRAIFIFFILIIGILLGSLGAKTAILIVTPLFLLLMIWFDESSYRRHLYRQEAYREQSTEIYTPK